MTVQTTPAILPTARYFKALCHLNGWENVRVRASNGDVFVYTVGKGAELVGQDVRIEDAAITDWEPLLEEAKA